MPETTARENSLVLYRMRPARVQQAGDKLTLELEGGDTAKVRPKDVVLLHPGPMRSLAELRPVAGDERTAWEILAGSATTLRDLAELAYGAFTPASAWAVWQSVAAGIYFRGTPDAIHVVPAEEVQEKLAARAAEAAEKQAWELFLARARRGAYAPGDERYLREVENLALGRSEHSRALHALGHEESPENAHALLLEIGRWTYAANPYPARLKLDLAPPATAGAAWPASAQRLADEARLDLTDLSAFAIDDEGTDVPDDAVSYVPGPGGGWQGARLWVHVADPAALIQPGDAIDLEARARVATLYLPEAIVSMLPPDSAPLFALGLAEISPALSFCLELDQSGQAAGLEIVPSRVRVTRLTYDQAEARLAEEPFSALYDLALRYEARRREDGAVSIELPEVNVAVRDGEISVQPVLPLRSRALVENAMIMAGAAVARFGQEHEIPLPFATQEPPEARAADPATPGASSLAGMYGLRRTLKRSQYRSAPAPHSGLGLPVYTQVTSPMRRYLDLVVHQQLRAYLRSATGIAGPPLLSDQEILERVGAVEAVIGAVRHAEQLSNRHWTLVHLMQHPKWRGAGVLVDRRGANGVFLIPELGLEVQVHSPRELPLDTRVTLVLRSVDLPRLDARFKVEMT